MSNLVASMPTLMASSLQVVDELDETLEGIASLTNLGRQWIDQHLEEGEGRLRRRYVEMLCSNIWRSVHD